MATFNKDKLKQKVFHLLHDVAENPERLDRALELAEKAINEAFTNKEER